MLEFLADRIRNNVRRLEGALMRVASYISLSDRQITPRGHREPAYAISFRSRRAGPITIEQIQRKVAEHFDVRLADMTSKRRPANIAFPRQVAMYLARELTKSSLSEIGDAFGGQATTARLFTPANSSNAALKRTKRHATSSRLLDSQLQR